jgi:pilus assembly protein CpaB
MTRRTRTFVVLGLAVVLALVATAGVYRAIERIPPREVPVAHHFQVVTSQAVPLGTALAPEHVRLVGWPDVAPVEQGFANIEAVLGRGVIAPLVANEPVTEAKLAPREAGAGLPPVIPAGKRALAVRVNEVIGVAGFTVPGTHVDVVATMTPGSDSVARVIVSNVLVLAAGTKYDQDQARTGEPVRTTVVTLLVSPEEAERLALAANEGKIALALRNPLDTGSDTTPGARMTTLLGTTPPPAAPSAPRRRVAPTVARVVAPPPPYTVEVIRAAKRTEEIVK